MGASASKKESSYVPVGELLRQTLDFARWTLNDVREIHFYLEKLHGLSLSANQFEEMISIKQSESVTSQAIFEVIDQNCDGRIDGLEFIGGLILCCQGSFEEKARLAFEVYDFNLNGSLSPTELAFLMHSMFSGILTLTGKDRESLENSRVFMDLAANAFENVEQDPDGQRALTYEDFIHWSRSHRAIMYYAERFRSISEAATGPEHTDDPAIEGSDDDSDLEDEGVYPQHLLEFEQKQKLLRTKAKNYNIAAPWIIEPSFWSGAAIDHDTAPTSNLEIEWIHGYRSHDSRNNLRYTVFGDIVYIVAKIGVVYNKKTHSQRYYQGHVNEIISLAIHPSGDKVATGDAGPLPQIHIWSPATLDCLVIITGFHDQGIALLSFSSSGSTLFSVGVDNDHKLALWDWNKSQLLSSGSGGRKKLFACAVSDDGQEVVVCGLKSIYFLSTHGRILNKTSAFIGNLGCIQTFPCACYLGQKVIIGTAGGQIYQFVGRKLEKVIQAHALHEAVTCFYSTSTRLFSGGKDGVIRIWDSNLKPVGVPIDLGETSRSSEHVGLISVCSRGGKILAGTRSSEIFEIDEHTGQIEKFIDGHKKGGIQGLAVSGTAAEYATCGSDNSIRVWSIRKRCMLRHTKVHSAGKCLVYSTTGDQLVIGCADGSVILMNAVLTNTHLHFRHALDAISVVKYSPDGSVLAVGSVDGNIYLYNVINRGTRLTKKSVLLEHRCALKSLDFSQNAAFLQTADVQNKLLHWDVASGARIENMKAMRDIVWSTWSCEVGWPVNGAFGSIDSIQSMSRSRSKKILALATEGGAVRLYRYPYVSPCQIEKEFCGHNIGVSTGEFALNDTYLISTGGIDSSIIQWRIEYEEDDEQPAEAGVIDTAVHDLLIGAVENSNGDEFMAVKPYLGSIIPPTRFDPTSHTSEATDVDLKLEWIHGINCQTLRNMLFYTGQGEIVYPAASVGVVYNNVHKTQRFHVQHTKEIISIALHPSGKFVATGSAGKKPQIIVWNVETMATVCKIEGCHQRGVAHLAFDGAGGNQNGDVLASVGLDDNHTLAFHTWSKSLLIAKVKNTKKKVLACHYSAADHRLVTCGVNHITFWSTSGANVKSQRGIFGRRAKLQSLLSISSCGSYTVTGGVEGIILWEGHHAAGFVSGHSGPTNCLWGDGDILVSGGKDGVVKVWSAKSSGGRFPGEIQCTGQYDLKQKQPSIQNTSVRSVCCQEGKVLVATHSRDILELLESSFSSIESSSAVEIDEKVSVISSGHYSGELWGLAAHPTRPHCVTGGDDCTLRVWDVSEKAMIKIVGLPDRARAVTYSPVVIGEFYQIAAALFKGGIIVFNAETLEKLSEVKSGKSWCQDIKYSPNGKYLAAGSHDSKIYLYQTENYEKIALCRGHTSYITHLDFSFDSSVLQSNSGDYELLYWEIPSGKQIKSASSVRDVEWFTWTCTLGWPVQGIFSAEADGTDVNAVERSHGQWKEVVGEDGKAIWTSYVPVVATGDDDGLIKMLKYPCIGSSSFTSYEGHATHITKVAFLFNDSHLLSIGGRDNCLFVWKTDCIEEALEAEAVINVQGGSLGQSILSPSASGVEYVVSQADEIHLEIFHALEEMGGDEFMAIKPWTGAIREPSNWNHVENPLEPDQELQLNFVYGYRAFDTRNNLRYADDKWEIVYHAAAIGVVYNAKTHTQIYNRDHTDDIISLAVHPEGHTVATGEQGKNPKIIIWDANSGSSLSSIKGFHKRGVSQLAFNRSGALIASVGLDNDHSVAVYRLDGTMIASSKGGQQKVLGIAFKDEELVTVGVKHVQFWTLRNSTLSSKKGIFGKKGNGSQPILCVAFVGDDVATSQLDGTVYIWKGRNCSLASKGHKGAVDALSALGDGQGVISGGKDGLILVWGRHLEQTRKFDMNQINPKPFNCGVRSVCLREGKILVGTLGCEIFEIDLAQCDGSETTLSAECLVQGHCKGELWGLDVHPRNQEFVTAGDDGSIRLWDAPNRKLLSITSMNSKTRALAFSPDGNHIAAGLYSGAVQILSGDLKTKITALECSKKWIEVMRYSPNGKLLAVGSHDRKIYIFTAPEYTKKAICKGHGSYITHLDFSEDSKYLQSNCGAYELLFWTSKDGKQIKSATAVRDVKWASWTCTLGWPVQGIWPECADGTDVNSVCRSQSGKVIATSDDSGLVNLFRYPCVTPGSKAKSYRGHSSHVTSCCFTQDDQYLLTTGGSDNCVLQFKLN